MPSSFHAYFIYGFAGLCISFALVQGSLKFFSIKSPGQRLSLLRLGLLLPMAGILLFAAGIISRCRLLPHGRFPIFFDTLCRAGYATITFLWPLLLFMVFLGLMRAAAIGVMVQRFRKHAPHLSAEADQRVRALLLKRCNDLGLGVPEVLYTVRPAYSALVLGLFRPVLILHHCLAEDLEDSMLDALLLHELMHIKHRDPVFGWLFRLVRDLMIFNPLGTLLLRGIFLERERLCDAEAAEFLGDKGLYAAALLKVWRGLLLGQGRRPAFATGLLGSGAEMEVRIASLLNPAKDDQKRSGMPLWPVQSGIVLLTFFALFVLC